MSNTSKTNISPPLSHQCGVLGRFCFCNTQSYNRYSYVLNNPLKYTDPSGWILKAAPEKVIGDDLSGGGGGGGGRGNMENPFPKMGVGNWSSPFLMISAQYGTIAAISAYATGYSAGPGMGFGSAFGTYTTSYFDHSYKGAIYTENNTTVGHRENGKDLLTKATEGSYWRGTINVYNSYSTTYITGNYWSSGSGISWNTATAQVGGGNGGGGASGSYYNSSSIKSTPNLNKISDVLNSLGIGTETKIAILNMAKGDLTAISGYLKSMKALSSVLGYSSVGISAYQYIQTPTTSNLLSFIATTSTVVVAGPVGSVSVGLLDVTKVSGGVYNLLGNIIDSYAGYSVGQSVYNNSASFFNQLIISKK